MRQMECRSPTTGKERGREDEGEVIGDLDGLKVLHPS